MRRTSRFGIMMIAVACIDHPSLATFRESVAATPESNLLRAIATGDRSSEAITRHLKPCVEGRGYSTGCEKKMALVLARLSEENEGAAAIVFDALHETARATQSDIGRNRLSALETELKRCLESGTSTVGNRPDQPKRPTPNEIAEWGSTYEASQRVEQWVASQLPADPYSLVRLALEGALATPCPDSLTTTGLCTDLPPRIRKKALLSIGLSPIWTGICEVDLADVYSKLGTERLRGVASAVATSGYLPLEGYDILLRKWAAKAPSRWEAWADAAAVVGW